MPSRLHSVNFAGGSSAHPLYDCAAFSSPPRDPSATHPGHWKIRKGAAGIRRHLELACRLPDVAVPLQTFLSDAS